MLRGYWEACLVLDFLLLSGWFLEPQVQGQPTVPVTTALTGSQVSLAGPNLPSMYKEIAWLFSANLKILIQDSTGVVFFKNHLENRVSLGTNGTLHIHFLRKNDSSVYILQLLKMDGTVEERQVPLQVYDPVPTPVITVQNLQHRGPGCFLNLSCHVPSSETHINYSWLGPKGFLSSNHVLEVTTDTSVSYTCQARNSLSSSNSTVSFAACSEEHSSGRLDMAAWLLVLKPLVLQFLLS
ncbi:CD48 antigen [Suncus etruscus]|uniref:CD48 antigen n=1 Tax=Suncus etruscus TaxID=109475 RepID=UPI002110BAB5|nr:CD48 antigen [Suncus etruscus]